MGKHINFHLLQMDLSRNNGYEMPYIRGSGRDYQWVATSMILTIEVYLHEFFPYPINELFESIWTIKQPNVQILFRLSGIGDININDPTFKLYSNKVKWIYEDNLVSGSYNSMDIANEHCSYQSKAASESFFCVPPCPTCMNFMKLYPECSKMVKGLIL